MMEVTRVEMTSQLEFIKEVIAMAEKNPSAQIKICVDNEFAAEFGWTRHEITRVKLTTWITVDDRIYTDEDLARDAISDMLYDDMEKELCQQDCDLLVDEYLKGNSTDAICVFTTAA